MPKKYDIPVKRSPKRDPQQYQVYRMESEAIGARAYLRMTRPQIRAFLRALCRRYHLPPLKVVFNQMRNWAAEFEAPNTIRVGSKNTSRDLLTVAHEFAHYLHERVAPNNSHQAHGKEFMCCYFAVLDGIRLLPIYAFACICDRYKIAYIEPRETDGLDQLAKRFK